jgi:predicted phosphodiesterase
MNIEIIGSIDEHCHYYHQDIEQLLNQNNTNIKYGATFMSRPCPHSYVGSTAVVKLRTELDLHTTRAYSLTRYTLKQERKLGVHHPHKTWFLIHGTDGRVQMGNICPRLLPVDSLPHQTEAEIDLKISYVEKIYRSYFQVASAFLVRLDEDLSNFGLDDSGQLYYLNDDLYAWDHFISFVYLIGVLIRNNIWLNEPHALILGQKLQQLISEFFSDSHTNVMVARKLQDVFMPDNNRQLILNRIIEQLQQRKIIRKQAKTYQHDLIAIFSDIHANLPALEAVLDFLETEKIHQGMILGDIVGYGPHPNECIDRLQHTDFTIIKGNHDHAVATGDSQCGMSAVARWCIDWSIERLSETQRQWLKDLPLELNSPNNLSKTWRAVHGAPIDPNYFYGYVYQMTYAQNLDVLAEQQIDFCFHGHSHIQGMYVRCKNNWDQFVQPLAEHSLTNFKHALICPGAVGQPRDGCIGAQLAIYNQRNHQLHFVVLDYNLNKTISDLKMRGFPEILWERLKRGS